MILFTSDYTEGAHPRIIEKLAETNMEQTVGYGEDPYCEEAREAIKKVCEAPEADVHFLVGGTQTNFTVISSILRPFQGVICADSGHINVHETGAVEATGHKVLALPSKEGKITGQQIKEYYDLHWSDESREHIVQPKMVYISHPTEVGTLYTKAELEDISSICKECGPVIVVRKSAQTGLNAAEIDRRFREGAPRKHGIDGYRTVRPLAAHTARRVRIVRTALFRRGVVRDHRVDVAAVDEHRIARTAHLEEVVLIAELRLTEDSDLVACILQHA